MSAAVDRRRNNGPENSNPPVILSAENWDHFTTLEKAIEKPASSPLPRADGREADALRPICAYIRVLCGKSLDD